jgi:hypothetical protein
MKKILTTCLFSLFLLTAIPTQAAAPVAQIQAVLAEPSIICGRFDQTKQLVGIKKPLVSYGRFCVVAGKGVLWQTLQPFPNTLRLTPDAIVQLQGDRVITRLDAQQEPVVRMINSVLFSVLAGDLQQLNKVFELDGSIHNNHWRVALHARAPTLAKAIGDITLQGDNYVRKVMMQEASGDRTEIIFSAIKSGDKTLNAKEEALFE